MHIGAGPASLLPWGGRGTGVVLTYISQTPHGDGEALSAWQQVVLEAGQPFGLGHLHADLVLLPREPSALAVNQELEGTGRQSHMAPCSQRVTVTRLLPLPRPCHTPKSHMVPRGPWGLAWQLHLSSGWAQ